MPQYKTTFEEKKKKKMIDTKKFLFRSGRFE